MIALLVAMTLVIGAGAAAVSVLWPLVTSLTASNDYPGSGSGTVFVTVNPGDTSSTIGVALERGGVVKSAKAFKDAAAGNPRSAAIQPGVYAARKGMSALSALAILVDPANRNVPRVTIREGLWTSEVIKTLATATGRPLAEYRVALASPELLGLPSQARGKAEGYLFPSTYEFAADATAAEQLHTMVAKSLAVLRTLRVVPARVHRVLTVASIVEAEGRSSADRPKVARVVENRLVRAVRLQMDSTVHYVSQRRGKAGTTTRERLSVSPYNTYRVAGLPPGPIGSPGLSALKAALSPTPGRWMYFVAVNPATGATRFSVDAAGHAANVKLFLAWCARNKGQC